VRVNEKLVRALILFGAISWISAAVSQIT